MDIIKVAFDNFEAFSQLEREFYAETKKNDAHYLPQELTEEFLKKVFEERLRKKHGLFIFAKEGNNYIGYLYGYIMKTSEHFARANIGYIDSVYVQKSQRGKHIAAELKDTFLDWLKNENITLVQIHVSNKNSVARDIYEHWGFAVDELRLFKEL